MVSFFTALATTLVAVGVSYGVDALARLAANDQELSPGDANAMIDKMLSAAKAKGNQALSALLNKINSLQVPPVLSSSLRAKYDKYAADLQKKKVDVEKRMTEAEQHEAIARSNAATLDTLNPLTASMSVGHKLKDRAKESASLALADYAKVEQAAGGI